MTTKTVSSLSMNEWMDGPGPPWCSQLTIQHDGPFCATFPFIRDLFCLKNNSYIQWLVQISKFTFTFCSLGSRTHTHTLDGPKRAIAVCIQTTEIGNNPSCPSPSLSTYWTQNRGIQMNSWIVCEKRVDQASFSQHKQAQFAIQSNLKSFNFFFVNIFYWPFAIVSTECKARAIITILVVVVVVSNLNTFHISRVLTSTARLCMSLIEFWLCAKRVLLCLFSDWLAGWLDTKCSISCNGHPMVPGTLDHCVDAIIHWAQSGCSLACVPVCAIEKYQDIFHAGKVTASRTRCTTTTFPTFSCSNWILVQSSTARSRRGPSHWMSVIIAHCNNEI